MVCSRTVHNQACEQTTVIVTPHADVGDVQTFCRDNIQFGPCVGNTGLTCHFQVHQEVCIEIPLTFSATAETAGTVIQCDPAEAGVCPGNVEVGCTHSQGFFKNHPDVTAALITLAGGSIVLGIDAQGASFTVTDVDSANVVFDRDVPIPPAPTENNFNNQYASLYIQLLAARLNVLNGATCQFALDTIDEANSFLANSPPEGQAGAPAFTNDLTLFNEGNAPGCPEHCPDDDDNG